MLLSGVNNDDIQMDIRRNDFMKYSVKFTIAGTEEILIRPQLLLLVYVHCPCFRLFGRSRCFLFKPIKEAHNLPHFLFSMYRSSRRAGINGSCIRVCSTSDSANSAVSTSSPASALQSTLPQGSTARLFP